MNANNVYDITLQQIATCVLVASVGSFSGAASTLYMTQSAVSKQIKSVEDRIGFTIFVRGRNSSLTLTPVGSILISQWQTLVKNYNLSLIQAEQEQVKNSTSITIAVSPSLNTKKFLLPAIMEFRAEHPHSQVHINLLSPGRAKKALVANRADVVISTSYRKDLFYTEDFECEEIIKCNWHIAMSKKNPLAGRKTLDWKSLRNQNFIILNDYIFIRMLDSICKENGFEPRVAQAVDTFSAFGNNLSDDKTVFLCDPYMNDFGLDNFIYFEMENTPIGYLMITKAGETNQLTQEFTKHLKNYTRKNSLNGEY